MLNRLQAGRGTLRMLALALAAICLLAAGAAFGEADEARVLRVGFEGMVVPCSWTQSDDSNGAIPIEGSNQYLAGFEVMYMQRVCELLGYRLEAYKYDWDGLMMAVPSRQGGLRIDMIAPTADRRQTMDSPIPTTSRTPWPWCGRTAPMRGRTAFRRSPARAPRPCSTPHGIPRSRAFPTWTRGPRWKTCPR